MTRLSGPDRLQAAEIAARLTGTFAEVLPDLVAKCIEVGLLDETDEPTRGFVQGLLRSLDKLRAKYGRTDDDSAENDSLTAKTAPKTRDSETCDFVPADERRAELLRFLGTTRKPDMFYYQTPRDERLVAAVGDLHGGFEPSILASLVRVQADEYIIGGDLGDQKYASQHGTMTREEAEAEAQSTYQQESADVRAGVEVLLDETGGCIKYFRGNHDAWSWRSLTRVVPPWALELVRDPFELMMHGLGPRVKVVGFQVKERMPNGTVDDLDHTNEFMFVMGDVLFSHLNKTSSMTEAGVSKLYRMWFVEWDKRLGLEHIQVIVHFHVHARNYLTRRGGYMHLIEPGMGGRLKAEVYKHSYQGPRWKPGIQGFVTFVQYRDGDLWRTDLASIDLVSPRITGKNIAA